MVSSISSEFDRDQDGKSASSQWWWTWAEIHVACTLYQGHAQIPCVHKYWFWRVTTEVMYHSLSRVNAYGQEHAFLNVITVKRPICLYPVCCPFLNFPKHLRSFVKMLVELECISILHEYKYLLNVGSYICVSVPLCLSCCRSMCLSPRCEVEDKQWEGPKVIKVMWLHVCACLCPWSPLQWL